MFSTGEFSRVARVSKRLLHFYDEEGVLSPVHTDPKTGYRRYHARQLIDLNRILVLRELGLSLDETRRSSMQNSDNRDLIELLRRRKEELELGFREDLRRLQSIEARLTGEILPDVLLKPVAECQAIVRQTRVCHGSEAWPWVMATASAVQRIAPQHDKLMILTMPGDGFETDNFAMTAYVPFAGKLTPGLANQFDDFHLTTLPGMKAAATIVQSGGPALLHRGCTAIGEWIEKHGFRVVGSPREVLLTYPLNGSCHDLIVEVQFPVEQ